ELGQAFQRLGVDVTGVDQLESIGHLDDPEINAAAIRLIGKDMPLWLGAPAAIEEVGNGKLRVSAGARSVDVDRVLVCIGRRPNLDGLNLQAAGIAVNSNGVPDYNPNTMQVGDLPVFLAGDVNGDRPLLHEAADEGRIAGLNAAGEKVRAFRRKTPLYITFSDPNIVLVGKRFSDLDSDSTLIGSVDFGMLGRALIMGRNTGILRLYADKATGLLRGAAMVAPHGEHLGHLLNWCIEQGLTVQQMLRMPFYHPVLEEAIQPVLRDLVTQANLATGDYPPDLELL
ncbi:MAG: FAD-dependent oxidoreductase, partial [Thiogranum sp.]|nr:FAD-dependent oxidoreductase [Thiogranum sp.]